MTEKRTAGITFLTRMVLLAIVLLGMAAFCSGDASAAPPPAPTWGETPDGRIFHKCYEATLDVDNPDGAAQVKRVPCDEQAHAIHDRAIQQADEYMTLVNRLTEERDKAMQQVSRLLEVSDTLIEQKAKVEGDLAALKYKHMDLEHDLAEAERKMLFKDIMMISLMIIIAVFTAGVIYQRRKDLKSPPNTEAGTV